ncbi:hypothetical protein CSOJ01_02836 [Colletotrichum sojae]|uniref:Uncharacterized protein n=1 Tax=Colletotrichum sojae TaxID=2175907 RepID=A0A8H6N229_9PEZI|nr:hypothetical protein CSOJ01_02836 [Colletotrichum sojae]
MSSSPSSLVGFRLRPPLATPSSIPHPPSWAEFSRRLHGPWATETSRNLVLGTTAILGHRWLWPSGDTAAFVAALARFEARTAVTGTLFLKRDFPSCQPRTPIVIIVTINLKNLR